MSVPHKPEFFRQDFQRLLKKDGLILGTSCHIYAPEIVEILGSSGFDYVVIDTEHSHTPLDELHNMIRAADSVQATAVVRIPTNDPIMIMKALDAGAAAVIVPHTETREQAINAVRAAQFAPKGERGAFPYVRGGGKHVLMKAEWKEYAEYCNTRTGVLILVEGKNGIENLESIVSVPGIQGFLLGPVDLSVALGHEGDIDHPEVQEAFKKALGLSHKYNVPMIIPFLEPTIEGGTKQLNKWRALGGRLFWICLDKMFLKVFASSYVQALHDSANKQ